MQLTPPDRWRSSSLLVLVLTTSETRQQLRRMQLRPVSSDASYTPSNVRELHSVDWTYDLRASWDLTPPGRWRSSLLALVLTTSRTRQQLRRMQLGPVSSDASYFRQTCASYTPSIGLVTCVSDEWLADFTYTFEFTKIQFYLIARFWILQRRFLERFFCCCWDDPVRGPFL